MRRLVGIVVVVCSMVAGSWAFSGEWGGEAATCYCSKYVWRGIRFSRGGVQQTQATVEYKGFAVNVWTNFDYDDTKLNEIDTTFTYSRDFGKFSLSAGLVHYGIVDGADSDEIFSILSYSGWPVTPSVSVYVDVNAGKGAFVQAAVSREQEFNKVVSLNVGASVGLVIQNGYMGVNDLGEEFTNFHSGELTASLPLKLSSNVTFEPKVGYSFPLSTDGKQAIRNASFGSDSTTLYGMFTLTVSF